MIPAALVTGLMDLGLGGHPYVDITRMQKAYTPVGDGSARAPVKLIRATHRGRPFQGLRDLGLRTLAIAQCFHDQAVPHAHHVDTTH
jgi:hypothetical protein